MAKIVEVPFRGGSVLFEAPDAQLDGARGFSAEDVIEKAEDTLDDAIATVCRVGAAFADQLRTLKFDSAEVTLGVKIAGKGKFIVAEASAEASLQVKITFKADKE